MNESKMDMNHGSKKVIAVLGGTGRIGSPVVESLRLHGFHPRVLTRSPEKSASFPPDVEGLVGDPHSKQDLNALVDGAYGVFFVSLHDRFELQMGEDLIEAARAAKAQKIVYASAGYPNPKNAIARKLIWAFIGAMSPHYKPKLKLDATVRALPNGTVLMPANFFQNDDIFRNDILLENVYPQPIGSKGTCRIDTRDVGDAAVKIFSEEGHAGRSYPLAGRTMNGDDVADELSDVLGKPVRYAGDDLDAWENRVRGRITANEMSDWRKSYILMQRVGFGLPEDSQRQGEELLGRPYRQYKDYARELLLGNDLDG